MKHLLYLGLALMLYSCSASKNTTAKATTTAKTTTTAPDTTENSNDLHVQVHIKNTSKLTITNVSINPGNDEVFTFDEEIKPGKTSSYQPVNALCNCGYKMTITYKTETGMHAVYRDCVNMMPCTDYFKGKLLIDIAGTDPVDNKVDIHFRPE